MSKRILMAVMAIFLLLSSPVLASDRDMLYTSEDFEIEYKGIGSHLLQEPDVKEYPANPQGVKPLRMLTLYEQSGFAPVRSNAEYYKTTDYAMFLLTEAEFNKDSILSVGNFHYDPIRAEMTDNMHKLIAERNLGYGGQRFVTAETMTRAFLEDKLKAQLNGWTGNIDDGKWLLRLGAIEFYRTGNSTKDHTPTGKLSLLSGTNALSSESIDAALREIIDGKASIRPGFEKFLDDFVTRAEFINLKPEDDEEILIPFYRFTQVDLIHENGKIVEVNVPIKNAPLKDYLNGNQLKIKPAEGAKIKEWLVSNKFTEPNNWNEVKKLPNLSSGTGTPVIKTLQMNTVIYVLHEIEPDLPDFYVKSLTANTTSVSQGKKYQGNVIYGLKDKGFPAEAKLTLTHNSYSMPPNGQTMTLYILKIFTSQLYFTT